MKRFIVIWLGLLALATPLSSLCAQDTIFYEPADITQYVDTMSVDTMIVLEASAPETMTPYWKPDPMKSVWLGAIVPGLGQIYNRSYWKLPIVYGAFMGCGYAISYNNTKYESYKEAYRDIITDAGHLSSDPNVSYNKMMPEGYNLERLGGENGWKNTLNSYQNSYRRYRDISIVATVLVYALSLIDAYVDAQLFDFDISEDLSLNIQPQLYFDDPLYISNPNTAVANKPTPEMKLAIRF